MATRKNLGRWPMIFGDYNEAIAGNIDPVPKEVFLDTVGKDMYYYDPSGVYVSIISLIRAGIVDTWLPPCISYEAILATWPDPPLCTVCAAIDSGIIYEYIGKGNWIPISANSIPIVSKNTNGLMSKEMYEELMEYAGGVKYKYVEQGQPIPLPNKRKKNYYYQVWKNTRASADEIWWVEIDKVDSIEGALRPDWPYDQLFLVGTSNNAKDEIYEIKDPLIHIVASDEQVMEEEIPEGYNGLFYMVPRGVIVVKTDKVDSIADALKRDWPYDQLFYIGMLDGKKEVHEIVDPLVHVVATDTQVKEEDIPRGYSGLYYMIAGVMVETVNPVDFTYGAYPDDWQYDKNFYHDKDDNINSITDPGYLSVKSQDKVVETTPAEGMTGVYYRVLKNTVDK